MSSFASDANGSVIVHSHLRWDFVWQRPQQLLSRMSRYGPVLFVEEPMYVDDASRATLDITEPQPAVHRVVPLLPAAYRGAYDQSIATVRELLGQVLAPGTALGSMFSRPLQWFYTPMPAPAMIGAFNEVGIVYDCMDELSGFRFAPRELIDREAYLLAEADVVFAGGHRLAEAKAKRHRNVHFFGCGVDVQHFGAARDAMLPVAEDIARLASPVAGYYGVIDERIDYALLATLAAALPTVQFAMVGPVVKVDPAELPHAANIHWLGQRSYDELPAIVKGFDVCLMPFARNEATEYINPTKTLEYMAAGKPIVSTDIPDVVHHFTPVVATAHTAHEFVGEVCRALHTTPVDRIAQGIAQASDSSWDRIVSDMRAIITDAVRRQQEPVTARTRATRGAAGATRHPEASVESMQSGVVT